jgi:hypothetical protein
VRCCNHFSLFIITELGVGGIVGNVVAFLWRGAWGGFGGTNVRPLIIALVVSVSNQSRWPSGHVPAHTSER